ncbi:MAG TPA: dockerin type I domain-containing protein [Pirellulaceae bacterium]
MHRAAARRRHRSLRLEMLETRRVFAAGFAEFVDPHPADGNQFGASVVPLSTGNVVVTSPFDDAGGTDAGAVYLFNGRSGQLISTLIGSHPNDHVGLSYPAALANGNFVISSPDWDSDAAQDVGAATWGSGVSGINGVVSAANSLVGSTASDHVGSYVVGLKDGNYIVAVAQWDNAGVVDVGAVTRGDGTEGTFGEVTADNSLVGTTAGDQVGTYVTTLANGNFVVNSPNWHNGSAENAGAVTFVDAATGLSGTVTSDNSLVGTAANDKVGGSRVYPLANGNYVVLSWNWHSNTGAATFANGDTGISGSVSEANSLVGSRVADGVGAHVNVLPNSNYLVVWPTWDNGSLKDAGAVTFGNGTSGVSGSVSPDNSLVGDNAFDNVGNGSVTVLTNGNYVVRSYTWSTETVHAVGAVTFGDGSVGVQGMVSVANSLVGTHKDDQIGSYGVTRLANGNYVVLSPRWDNDGIVDVGAVTFGNGMTGVAGAVDSSNSLVGTTAGDRVGDNTSTSLSTGVVALANGNYVVLSPQWDSNGIQDAGAATFGGGVTGAAGLISDANSLVGTAAGDQVGIGALVLSNGNYVVLSPNWDDGDVTDVGAATFGNGQTGVSGPVNEANSLVGRMANDRVGWGSSFSPYATSLTNGNYLIDSPSWDDGSIVDAGAVTFGNGVSGVAGTVNADNSLVGNSAYLLSQPYFSGIAFTAQPIPNGNYLVFSSSGDNGNSSDIEAVTFGDGVVGVSGHIDTTNSAMGSGGDSALKAYRLDDVNQNITLSFPSEGGGRVRVGSQIDGFSHRWHLAVQPQDVNNDGHVAADDVIGIINYINAQKPVEVASDAAVGGPYGFLDVTGDDHVVAEDVIAVINYINAHPEEQEAATTQLVESNHQSDDDLLLMMAADAAGARRK